MKFSSSFLSFLSFLPPLLISLVLTSCGSGYETSKIKNYSMARIGSCSDARYTDADLDVAIQTLVDDFNRLSAMQVLDFKSADEGANSSVIIDNGLRERDGKVGWGQWIAETKEENPYSLKMPGQKLDREVEYSMRLQLDATFVCSRMNAEDEKKHYELQKLFFHEVGHGLEMDHPPESPEFGTDVMFFDIGDIDGKKKDFDNFFERVRSYMLDS